MAQHDALRRLYRRADVLVCDREEAVEIGGGDHIDVASLLDGLQHLGAKTTVVTDGPAGAYASDGRHRFRVPIFSDPAPPRERTGAGDAFASTVVAALIKGRPLHEAMAWAPINAMSVVQHVGSQTGLLDETSPLQQLKDAPEDCAVVSW